MDKRSLPLMLGGSSAGASDQAESRKLILWGMVNKTSARNESARQRPSGASALEPDRGCPDLSAAQMQVNLLPPASLLKLAACRASFQRGFVAVTANPASHSAIALAAA
jgi:hypothetical protein